MLRDYQQEMVERLLEAWKTCRSVMVQMPTGTGKTHLMAEAVRRMLALDCGQVLIVAHRQELLQQVHETITRLGLQAEKDGIRVESIQWLARHLQEVDCNPGLIVVDEAHHTLAVTYRMLWDRWPKAKFLGLTATPCRLNGAPFTDLFDTLLQSGDIRQFIDKGILADFDYVSARPEGEEAKKVAALNKRGADGDYQIKEMAAVMDVPESIAHLYESYKAFANGRKGIVYAIDRQHAAHIAEYYAAQGVSCCAIDAKTPVRERTQKVQEYREGKVDVIVNVDIFSEGFDCPEVEFIQLARPTLSLAKYLQQVGRGMRVTKGKEGVVIIDQVGMYQIFGLPTDDRDWSLMFAGKQAGKGTQGTSRPVVIREETEKELVNLEMVRIKNRSETHQGAEIFMLGGRYGIMVDGKVTCPAEFEQVTRIGAPYFALARYPYYVYKNKVTVIDDKGRDLRSELYGKVRQEGDVFIGQDVTGKMTFWDAKGGRRYLTMPHFEHIMRFEVARTGDQLRLRKSIKGWESPFNDKSVYLHDHFTIMGNVLVLQNDIRHSYRIRGYDTCAVYVESSDVPGYRYGIVNRFGNLFHYTNNLPRQLNTLPDIRRLGLRRLAQRT